MPRFPFSTQPDESRLFPAFKMRGPARPFSTLFQDRPRSSAREKKKKSPSLGAFTEIHVGNSGRVHYSARSLQIRILSFAYNTPHRGAVFSSTGINNVRQRFTGLCAVLRKEKSLASGVGRSFVWVTGFEGVI